MSLEIFYPDDTSHSALQLKIRQIVNDAHLRASSLVNNRPSALTQTLNCSGHFKHDLIGNSLPGSMAYYSHLVAAISSTLLRLAAFFFLRWVSAFGWN